MKKRSNAIGPMSKNSAHVPHYIPQRVNLDIPDRITNASSTGRWSYSAIVSGGNSRPGCMDAYSLPSRGF